MNFTTMMEILLGEFHEKLGALRDLVERDVRLPQAPGKIKVAIGMRRAGKTYVFYQHVLKLLASGIDKTSILYLNCEDDRLFPWTDQKLARLVEAYYTLYPKNHDEKCYLFFDEIQHVENWPLVIRRLHDTKNIEIFLTGSSAKLLSKEIATTLRGRSLPTEVWPYSFNEYIRAKKVIVDRSLHSQKAHDILRQLFEAYLSEGGFPEIVSYRMDVKQQTLQEYLNVAIYRDIVERHEIKSPALIKYMILSMIHNVGKPFAVNKFYNGLRSQGYRTSKDTLYAYVDYIEDAYLAFTINMFDKSLRKSETRPKKLYTIDPGLIRALTLDYTSELGRLFENVVYLDLKRLGCKINYYQTVDGYEIDFVAQTPQGYKKLFQVVWDMEDPLTLERETRALQAGMKELKADGEIITMDAYLRNGIKL